MFDSPIVAVAVMLLNITPLPIQNTAKTASHESNTAAGEHESLVSDQLEFRNPQQGPAEKKDNVAANDNEKRARWGVYINGALALATLVLAIFAVVQAKAAKRMADAMINSERAWVVAELVPICAQFGKSWHRPAGNGWAAMSEEEILKGDYLKHKIKFTNMGRTPAHILGFQIGYSCLLEGVTDLPKGHSGDVVEKRGFDHLLTGPGSVEITDPIIDVDQFRRDSIRQIGDSQKIEDARWTLVFHGWVEYLHVFSEEAVRVPFCYVYTPSLKRLSRVPAAQVQKQSQDAN